MTTLATVGYFLKNFYLKKIKTNYLFIRYGDITA